MKTTIVRAAGVLSAACVSVSLVHAAYAPGGNLYINGGLASSRVFQHNGMACVPVADVAKALNQVVVAKSDGYTITTAGGSNQIAGLNGKIGDKLMDGESMITVVKAFRTDTYMCQFDTGHTVTPNAASDDLVVTVIRLKNMKNKSVDFFVGGAGNTSLTDQDEHSYKSVYTDAHQSAPTLLPASAFDFALCFSVPKTEKIGDLVYQISSYGRNKPSIFRVSAASVNP